MTLVYSIKELREARLAKAARSQIVDAWRSVIACSCVSYNCSDFGDCIQCVIGKTILESKGASTLMEFLDSIRMSFADHIEDQMSVIPFNKRDLRCTLAEMAHKLRTEMEVPAK